MATPHLQKLEADITAFVNSFANLVRSAQIEEGSEEGKRSHQERRVPGEVVEVLVEKVITSGHSLLELIAGLKRSALPANFAQKNEDTRELNHHYGQWANNIRTELQTMSAEMTSTLQDMELSYYSSSQKVADVSNEAGQSDSEALLELAINMLPS